MRLPATAGKGLLARSAAPSQHQLEKGHHRSFSGVRPGGGLKTQVGGLGVPDDRDQDQVAGVPEGLKAC
jgi:hypothetical protein